MRKVQLEQFGGPEVLGLVEAEAPEPGTGQIRIVVVAAGVNAVDWRRREGQTQGTGPLRLPTGVGQDAAGVVDRVGPGVSGVDVGERVFGRGLETYAELALLSSWALTPPGLPLDEAAAYPSVVETALRVLHDVGIEPGQTLLVSGAAGGVGSSVLQIARARGVGVVATASAENQDYVRSLGASATTYDAGWVERVRAVGSVDAALDLAGAGVVEELIELTGDPGRVVSTADLTAPELGARFASAGGDMFVALAETVRLVETGALRLPIERRYSLDEAVQAQVDSQAGHTRGRRIIVVQPDADGNGTGRP